MKKAYLIVALSIIVANELIAQPLSGTIYGKVFTSDGYPAAGVTVWLSDLKRGTTAAEDGSYALQNVPAGEHEMTVSLIGHRVLSQQIRLRPSQQLQIKLQLQLSEAELEEVIITNVAGTYHTNRLSASLRQQTSLLKLPQNVQVVTAKAIRDQQIFDMLEGVTRNLSGASRKDSWDNYAEIVMRGTTISAFRNGMNVKMPWGPLVEDMSTVERIEFVKGPAGFMMGSGEPGGFYNIVTKKPTGITRGEVGFSMGSYDTYRTTLDLEGKLDKASKLLYRMNIVGQRKNSHRDFDFNKRYGISPVLKYQFNPQTSLTAEYTYQHMQMAMLGSAYIFSPLRYGELPRNFSLLEAGLQPTNIGDHSLFLTLDHRLNENWKLTVKGAYLSYLQTGASMWPARLERNGDLLRSVANWDAYNEGWLGQAFMRGRATTGSVTHKILAGIDMHFKEYYADFYQAFPLTGHDIYGSSATFNIYQPVHGFIPEADQPLFNRTLPLKLRGGATLGESENSLYMQDEIGLLDDRLRLTLAGRYTSLVQHSYGVYSRDHQLSPRVGVSVSLNPTASVYALYDRAFVAQQGADSAARPFVPVTGNSIEAGIKKDFYDGRWNAGLSAYRIIRNNVVSVVPGPVYATIQTGQTETSGVELDVRGEIAEGLNLIFNYAYTHAKVTKDEDPSKIGGPVPSVFFPDHSSNAWLSYRVREGELKGLGVAAGYQFQGGRKEELPDYFRLDGGISWQEPRLSIALNVNNLLNKYLFSGSLFEHNNDPSTTEYNYQVEAGIHFRLSFAYRF